MGNLVLSRFEHQTIILAPEGHEPIEVTVLAISDNRVRLACKADQRVAIHRLEVWETIQREKRDDEHS